MTTFLFKSSRPDATPKVVGIFEGRAAGKGGTIKRISECLNPRVYKVVALETTSDYAPSACPKGYAKRYAKALAPRRTRDDMFAATDIPESPWNVVEADDKKKARLNCISQFLNTVFYEDIPV